MTPLFTLCLNDLVDLNRLASSRTTHRPMSSIRHVRTKLGLPVAGTSYPNKGFASPLRVMEAAGGHNYPIGSIVFPLIADEATSAAPFFMCVRFTDGGPILGNWLSFGRHTPPASMTDFQAKWESPPSELRVVDTSSSHIGYAPLTRELLGTFDHLRELRRSRVATSP